VGLFGLNGQIPGAAVSVMNNIAEGWDRRLASLKISSPIGRNTWALNVLIGNGSTLSLPVDTGYPGKM
jgi:hypothetical protein